ncbi:hypothetical protein [Acetobacter okinawensis]|uniref:hypothetical protein n=1 Tax=Acetobacter okinawensis TaxID=1076594 RepID=UPI000A35EF68|nr:hypothetical protein [Acetobacter okinawensis]
MISTFWNWLLGVVSSAGIISGVAYLLRDTIGKFFAKAIEHQFEKKLETFKAGIRDNETELEHIRSFLVSARKDRDAVVQLKRLEAAEILLRARNTLSQLSMLVEYLKILNTDEIFASSENSRITDFIETLIKPFDIDEKMKKFGEIDKTLPRLYLSEKALKAFDIYENIIFLAAGVMKILSMPLDNKSSLLQAGSISKSIIEMVPQSKEGFDKFGESYVYYWSTYFHDEILRELRNEMSGVDDMDRAVESVEKLALNSRRAQVNVRFSLKNAGLSDSLLKQNENSSNSAPTEVVH